MEDNNSNEKLSLKLFTSINNNYKGKLLTTIEILKLSLEAIKN